MEKQDTKFKPGVSGNPSGRPNKSTRSWFNRILNGREEVILQKAIAMAMHGDKDMIKWIGERTTPPANKDDHADVDLIDKTYKEQGDEVLAAITEGRITPNQAHTIMAAISTNVQIVQATDIINRIRALEEAKK